MNRNSVLAYECLKCIKLGDRLTYGVGSVEKEYIERYDPLLPMDLSCLWMMMIFKITPARKDAPLQWLREHNTTSFPKERIDNSIYWGSNFDRDDTTIMRFMSYPISEDTPAINKIVPGLGDKILTLLQKSRTIENFYTNCVERLAACVRPVHF